MRKKSIAFAAVVFAAGGLSGCSSKYAVTFDSTPQGATLICSGTNWGYTPKTLYYDESVKEQYSINVSNCSANWVSGARAYYPSNLRVFPSGGTNITLPRPNVSGYSQDAEFALKVKTMEAQKRQATAAQNSANTYQNNSNKINSPVFCNTIGTMTICN